MMTSKGVATEFTGKKAIRALKIYQQWVSAQHPTSSVTQEEYEDMINASKDCKDHIRQVDEVMKWKNLVVSYI
jgi:hypothetical protein